MSGCPSCGDRATVSAWLPFCCEVCWDSADAEFQRDVESGRYDELLRTGEDRSTLFRRSGTK